MRIRVIDAFTDQPFAGNPAAVCLLDGDTWPDEGWMRHVAAEMNLSETAFAHRLPAGTVGTDSPDSPHSTEGTASSAADWALRWFTPTVEVDLCGHATLATAHALREDNGVPGTVRFSSRSGVLITTTHADSTVTLDFPAAPSAEITMPEGFADALGANPEAAYATGALQDLLVAFPDESAVRALAPDLTALAGLSRRDGIRGVIATAAAKPGAVGYDFVSRFFGPAAGIPEDPVTGSAHTALAPYWSNRLGRTELTGLQASARTGLVRTAVHGDRVHLTGHAVTVLDAELRAPAVTTS